MPAHFHDQEATSHLKNKRALSRFLDGLVRSHRPALKRISLTYVFVTDEALLVINRQFLDHDTYTDIVTFDLSEKETELTGELHISVDRVADNARHFDVTYHDELHRVIFHGALHLCGFGDKTEKEEQQMRKLEDAAVQAYYREIGTA
jgi:rRNA maturation RNase YbeY